MRSPDPPEGQKEVRTVRRRKGTAEAPAESALCDSAVEALVRFAARVSALADALERLTARLEAVCAAIPMPKLRQDAEEAEVVVGAPQEVIKPH